MTEFAKNLLQYVPNLTFPSILAFFFVNNVLKYKLKHLKLLCGICTLFAMFVGIFVAVAVTNPLPPDAEFILKLELSVENGMYEHTLKDDIMDFFSLPLYFVMFVTIAIGIREKLWKKIVISFLSISVLSSFMMIFSLMLEAIMGFVPQKMDGYWILTGSSFVLLILESLVFIYIAKIRTKHDNTPMPIRVLLIASLVLGLFLSSFGETVSEQADSNTRRVIALAFLLMTLAGTLIFFYIRASQKERIKLRDENTANEELITAQTEYFEASARADKEIRAIRHDMKNNIQVLALLLENKEYDKMRDYLEELGENLKSTDLSAHTGNTIADAIIADKTSKAADHGLTLRTSGKIKGVEISSVDMCKMLANLLDNAIEAASKPELSELSSEVKVIDIDFRSTGNFFMISATNPCVSCPVIKDGEIMTTKSDSSNHGFGIKNIRSAAANYDGEISISCDPAPFGGLFNLEIMIPISDNS